MQAAVNYVQVQPGKMNEVVAIIRDSVAPVVRQQRGNRGAILLTDANTNKAIVVALWETDADAAAMMYSGVYQEESAKLASVFVGPPIREVYEVSVRLV